MRVGTAMNVSQIYQLNQKKGVQSSKAEEKDNVSISKMARDYQILNNAVLNLPDVREDRVSELKKKMSSGKYEVSVDLFSDKLYDSYKMLNM